ncbi:MAG: tRNA glutamyl-Q(34) synthetase GluQRS [Opitutaceae bacterium]
MGPYVGRLAPSPTGFLHLGHARTFWIAHRRARRAGGRLRLRNDDLDPGRCRAEYVTAFQEDLRWLGLDWDGPMVSQSGRLPHYRGAFERLKAAGCVYPCRCSRREVGAAAPHEAAGSSEPLYPGTCRPENRSGTALRAESGDPPSWRFHVRDGEAVGFRDGRLGARRAVAGRDFGDFIVWRKDGFPSYQLACAVDDTAPELGITEVVRGEDLAMSAFRQILIARALGRPPAAYYHCALMMDAGGRRLAKRDAARSLRALRAEGCEPAELVERFEAEADD